MLPYSVIDKYTVNIAESRDKSISHLILIIRPTVYAQNNTDIEIIFSDRSKIIRI